MALRRITSSKGGDNTRTSNQKEDSKTSNEYDATRETNRPATQKSSTVKGE